MSSSSNNTMSSSAQSSSTTSTSSSSSSSAALFPTLPSPIHPSWLMNKEDIYNQSPSRLDGITYEQEHTIRKSTCVEIATIVNKILQRKEPIYSATIFFQRFFSRQSLVKHNRIAIAIACIMIAGKCTDFCSPAKIKDYIPEYLNRTGNTPPYQEKTELWVNTKEKLIQAERLVLYILEYDVVYDSPYKYLDSISKLLLIDTSSPLYEGALRCITEALRTTLCIQYDSRKLVLGCIYFSKEEHIRVHKPYTVSNENWNILYNDNNNYITLQEAKDILEQLRESIQLTKKTVADSIKQSLPLPTTTIIPTSSGSLVSSSSTTTTADITMNTNTSTLDNNNKTLPIASTTPIHDNISMEQSDTI